MLNLSFQKQGISGDYAIGFAKNKAATKGATVKLNVYLEGNLTAKANATVSVKVTLK